MRTFVIGDIHGALKGLHQVIDQIKPCHSDTLIFLGDYVDGWSESSGVIDYLIILQGQCNCIFIKGNHDAWCEEWLKSGEVNQTWFKHGGESTIKSYKNHTGTQKEQHLVFFERMKNYFVDDQNRLFIHAGFSSMHGPAHEMHASNFSRDRTLWEMAVTMDKRVHKDSVLYPKRLKLFNEIYIGHTPTLYYNVTVPMNAINVWNIDTGAAFTGKISALNVETKDYWQSDTVKDLYPGERGRN